MRRCKYGCTCNCKRKGNVFPEWWYMKQCNMYTPIEVDPYWKDIIDETNRRLYEINKHY